jgi:hypothetical protein
MFKMSLAQKPLEECARIDAGCGMRLKVDEIATVDIARTAKEMVEAYFKQIGAEA